MDELQALRELREICGMYCEQLPIEVREALHKVPEIEKAHPHKNKPLTREQAKAYLASFFYKSVRS